MAAPLPNLPNAEGANGAVSPKVRAPVIPPDNNISSALSVSSHSPSSTSSSDNAEEA